MYISGGYDIIAMKIQHFCDIGFIWIQ